MMDMLKQHKRSPAPMGSRLRLRPDGTVETFGIDYETRKITVECCNDSTLVLRVPGRSCWSGRFGDRHYAPPELLVFRILARSKKDPNCLRVEGLIEISLARKKKEE